MAYRDKLGGDGDIDSEPRAGSSGVLAAEDHWPAGDYWSGPAAGRRLGDADSGDQDEVYDYEDGQP